MRFFIAKTKQSKLGAWLLFNAFSTGKVQRP
jgi:hypothetical protein